MPILTDTALDTDRSIAGALSYLQFQLSKCFARHCSCFELANLSDGEQKPVCDGVLWCPAHNHKLALNLP